MASFIDLVNGWPKTELHERPAQTIERALRALDNLGGLNFQPSEVVDFWRQALADWMASGDVGGPASGRH